MPTISASTSISVSCDDVREVITSVDGDDGDGDVRRRVGVAERRGVGRVVGMVRVASG